MLSRHDNELLTRTGPGTPMGDVLRQYWQPVLFSSELLEPNGSPLRVRHLGEDLVAFRDTGGQIGLVGAHCPHRGASLFFGRNEEGGLRCVYHGWKYDVSGQCVDMPNEPAESNFKHKIRHTAYPCVERNGIIWTYMGPEAAPPPLPEFEWNLLPADQVHYSKRVATNNWVQALEGEIDSSHAPFLHSRVNPEENVNAASVLARQSRGPYYRLHDKHPRFETIDTEYGVAIAAQRNAEEDSFYYRVNQFLMPFYTYVPPYGPNPTYTGHAWMPMDDGQAIILCFSWNPARPLGEQERQAMRYGVDGRPGLHPALDQFLPPSSRPAGAWWPQQNKQNDLWHNSEAQQEWFSGIPGIWPQDSGCQESMGPIYDRSKEHLGVADTGIIMMRRRLLRAARALRERAETPAGAKTPAAFRVRSVSMVLPRELSWLDAFRERVEARHGVNQDAP